MVSSRQRRIKARRKAAKKFEGMSLIYLKKITQRIREESFRSLPEDIRKVAFASVTGDKSSINSVADISGQVESGGIGSAARKDIYEKAFPEDLEWASRKLREVK